MTTIIPFFPIAFSSQLDDTGVERIHSAPLMPVYRDVLIPPPPPPMTLDFRYNYGDGGGAGALQLSVKPPQDSSVIWPEALFEALSDEEAVVKIIGLEQIPSDMNDTLPYPGDPVEREFTWESVSYGMDWTTSIQGNEVGWILYNDDDDDPIEQGFFYWVLLEVEGSEYVGILYMGNGI